MNFLLSKSGRKFLFATMLMGVIIIGGVTAALYMLRQEAINTHLKIAELHARTFGDHISQTLHGINLATENISLLPANNNNFELMKKSFDEILPRMPYIRSLTLLDENGKAVVSTNKQNIGITLRLNNFLPVPFLDEQMLRFGVPSKGRDIFDSSEISPTNIVGSKDISFIPIIKSMPIGAKKYTLVIVLNGDYFINIYSQSLSSEAGFVDVARIDGVLLFSSDESMKIGQVQPQCAKMFASGSDVSALALEYENKESLVAYRLSAAYPIGVIVRLDYENTLKQWERQRINVLLITTILVVISAGLTMLLVIRSKKQQAVEAQILKSKIAAMGELIGMIAHQWRQPLSVISAIFSNIKDAYEDGELTKEYLDKTSKQGRDTLKYMSKTIDDFRGFFKPQESKKIFCLCNATMEAVKFSIGGLEAFGIKLFFNDILIDEDSGEICQSYMPVLGYKNEFLQALISMFKNSKEAIGKKAVPNGVIRIKTAEENGKYILYIFDNGGGVEKKAINRIFEPYYTTKHNSMGSGMGLYVVRVLIENGMDGNIEFENIDDGVMFTIELNIARTTTGDKNV